MSRLSHTLMSQACSHGRQPTQGRASGTPGKGPENMSGYLGEKEASQNCSVTWNGEKGGGFNVHLSGRVMHVLLRLRDEALPGVTLFDDVSVCQVLH